MEPPAAPLDTTPDPAIVQPPGANPPGAPQEQQQEQLRIGESGQFSEGLEDRGERPSVRPSPAFLHAALRWGEPHHLPCVPRRLTPTPTAPPTPSRSTLSLALLDPYPLPAAAAALPPPLQPWQPHTGSCPPRTALSSPARLPLIPPLALAEHPPAPPSKLFPVLAPVRALRDSFEVFL